MIDLDKIGVEPLPVDVSVTAFTMAELAAGPHATTDLVERARRQDRLLRAEAVFDPLPFNSAARAYGRIHAAVIAAGRKTRGARAVDLLIAAMHARKSSPSSPATPSASRHSKISSSSAACRRPSGLGQV